MNAIRQTALLNKRELENATPPSASWHVDYRDTAWIYLGGLSIDLSEGDVVTIFSQFGNPTHLNLIRDKDTGKPKGFGFLKYEDQRSCDLAVDNLGGAEVLGRLLRVDHTRYKRKEGEDEDTYRIDRLEAEAAGENGPGKRASDTEEDSGDDSKRKKRRKLLKEEKELEEMLAITQDGEEQDPMRIGIAIEDKTKRTMKIGREGLIIIIRIGNETRSKMTVETAGRESTEGTEMMQGPDVQGLTMTTIMIDNGRGAGVGAGVGAGAESRSTVSIGGGVLMTPARLQRIVI